MMPGVAATERIGGDAPVDDVRVALAARGPPRVEAGRRFARAEHADRRRQERVERPREAAGAMADAVVRLATWRSACTPASVRLAPVTLTGRAEHARGRRMTRPCTVGRLGWCCQPWKSVPSYASVSRSVRIPVREAVGAPSPLSG